MTPPPSDKARPHDSIGTSESRRATRQPGKLAGAIYGQIVVTSTLGAVGLDESLQPIAILLSLLATMLMLWIAHVYSELIAERVRMARKLEAHEVAAAAAADWPLVQAIAPAAVALLPAAFGVWSRDTGVDVGLAFGILSLFGWGVVIGRRSSFTWPRTLMVAAFSGTLGIAIVALELLLH